MNRNSPLLTFAICIPTYKRPELLFQLLTDLEAQSVKPNLLIVVDGDPSSEVVRRHCEIDFSKQFDDLIYIPSNHANLPYQRYLGWKCASSRKVDVLIYLDDDLKTVRRSALQEVIDCLCSNNNLIGVTARVDNLSDKVIGNKTGYKPVGKDKKSLLSHLVRRLGSTSKIKPGSMSPAGNRCVPVSAENKPVAVEWHYGRVMVYRMDALTEDSFSEDLFAMYEKRIGRGEDLFLSWRVHWKGSYLLLLNSGFTHPHPDTPQAYPTDAKRFGFVNAYSRRLLNDHYREKSTGVFDRLILLTSYVGNVLQAWLDIIITRKRSAIDYACGYTKGAVAGVVQKPTARKITPNINWWKDAELAIQNASGFRGE